jgi:hypothetical protein
VTVKHFQLKLVSTTPYQWECQSCVAGMIDLVAWTDISDLR